MKGLTLCCHKYTQRTHFSIPSHINDLGTREKQEIPCVKAEWGKLCALRQNAWRQASPLALGSTWSNISGLWSSICKVGIIAVHFSRDLVRTLQDLANSVDCTGGTQSPSCLGGGRQRPSSLTYSFAPFLSLLSNGYTVLEWFFLDQTSRCLGPWALWGGPWVFCGEAFCVQ
jgi:hypothetical protein